jgi:LmbE family N-acetylglucosaminyl deacetylase
MFGRVEMVRVLGAALMLWFVAQPFRAADVFAQQPSASDDRYQFAPGMSEEISITLERTPAGVRFSWPKVATNNWDTAILSVRSTGAEPEPWVEIVARSVTLPHHLDASASGLRWLNLTGAREQLSEGAPVEIRTHAVTLEPGTATLRLFANKLDLQGPILILAPHPDDAEIAAFGLYAGRNATIVTVTSGNAGDFNYRASVSDPARHYLLKGYLRAVDSVTVPWQGDIPPERCFNLGYFDARLPTMRQTPDQAVPEMYGPNQDVAPYRRANIGRLLPVGSRTNTWNHLVEDLVDVFRKVKPTTVVMPHPWLDGHLDHAFTAVAAIDALEKVNVNATFMLYTNHSGENRYPYGPAGTHLSLPPWPSSDLIVERVYAHRVDEEMQRRKLFALESMHDLRLSPEEQRTCDIPGVARRPDYPRIPAVDYLRRGPRPEELFFVYGRDSAKEVIRTFLARSAAPSEAR